MAIVIGPNGSKWVQMISWSSNLGVLSLMEAGRASADQHLLLFEPQLCAAHLLGFLNEAIRGEESLDAQGAANEASKELTEYAGNAAMLRIIRS